MELFKNKEVIIVIKFETKLKKRKNQGKPLKPLIEKFKKI